MKTIIITGINGYLGSRLAKRLSKDYKVIGLTRSLKNLKRVNQEQFTVYENRGRETLEFIFSKYVVDGVIHTATSYGRSGETFADIIDTNLFFPAELLEVAMSHHCNFFINSDTVLDRFVNNYSLSKRQFQEWLCFVPGNIRIINMQLECLFGPGAPSSSFVTSMLMRLMNNEACIDLTAGDQLRDFIHIDDVVSAYVCVLSTLGDVDNGYFNYQVCSEMPIRIKDLMILLKDMTKSKSILNFGAIPYRENELMKPFTRNGSLVQLGWSPSMYISNSILSLIDDVNGKL